MPKSLEERELKIDVGTLTEEQVEERTAQLGAFISQKIENTVSDIRKAAQVYGLDFHIMYEVTPADAYPMWRKMSWHRSQYEALKRAYGIKDEKPSKPAEKKKKSTSKKKVAKKKTTKKKTTKKATKKKTTKKKTTSSK